MGALVARGVHLRRVGEDPGGGVHHHGVVLPAALPQGVDDVHELVGDLVALVVWDLSLEPQVAGGAVECEVTMFHPMRPSVRWSSVVILRANWYGRWYVDDTVTAKPRSLVAAAMALIDSSGSSVGRDDAVAQRRVGAPLVHLERAEGVGDEEGVEATPLQDLGRLDPEAEVAVAMGLSSAGGATGRSPCARRWTGAVRAA